MSNPVATLLARFLRLAPWRLALGVAFIAATLAAGLGLLAASGALITGSALAGLGLIVFDTFQPSAAIRASALLRTVLRYGERLANHDATFRILTRLRVDVFRGLGAGTGRTRRTADLLARLSGDLDALDGIHLRLAGPTAGALLISAGLAVWLASISPLLAAAVVLPTLAGGIAAPLLIGLGARRDARRKHVALDALRGRIVALDRGRTEFAAAGRLGAAAGAVEAAADRLVAIEASLARRDAVLRAVGQVSGHLAIALAALAGAGLVAEGRLSAPEYGAVVLAAFAAGEAFAPLRLFALELGRVRLAAGRILPWMTAADGTTPQPEIRRGTDSPGIRFDAVTYRAAADRAPVLSTVDLTVAPGDRVAIVGASGSGKSTLLALAAGLALPSAGRVTVAGLALAAPGATGDGRRIGLLSQRADLFAGTLADALRLGRPAASDADLEAAVAAAGLRAVVDRHPDGLSRHLGEGGGGLSGGEQRRLALARLLVARPDIVLLDEPTEGLDAATAADVIARLDEATRGLTLVVATHGREEAALADRIIVLRDGRIVDDTRRGTPDFDRTLGGLASRNPQRSASAPASATGSSAGPAAAAASQAAVTSSPEAGT